MIRARRFLVGEELVDLAAGSAASSVAVQWLRNSGDRPLLIGDAEDPAERAVLAPGQTIQGLTLGPTDAFLLSRGPTDGGPHVNDAVDAILGWA